MMVLSQSGCDLVTTTLDGSPFTLDLTASSVYEFSYGCTSGAHGEKTVQVYEDPGGDTPSWSVASYELRGTEWTVRGSELNQIWPNPLPSIPRPDSC